MKQVARICNFERGVIHCKCGEELEMTHHGGEPEQYKCKCGLRYETEQQQMDLVVYRDSKDDSDEWMPYKLTVDSEGDETVDFRVDNKE